MYTLDRFARNRYDSAVYKAKLKKNGVKIFYAKQPMPDTPEGIILESVLEGYAEYYSENLRRGVIRGMHENALKGYANGPLPLGYVKGEDKKYKIDPVSARCVQEIFERFASGESCSNIIQYLNDKGYKTGYGKPFGSNSLYNILRNERYTGVYKFGDTVIEGMIPPIISKDLFEKAKSNLKHNKKLRGKNKADEAYLLTGKVFCGHCEAMMIGESGTSHTGRIYRYYKCSNRKRFNNCDKKPVNKEWLEEIVVRNTVETILVDDVIESIATETMKYIQREFSDKSLLKHLEQELRDINKKIDNLVSAIEQGIFTKTTKDRLTELENLREETAIRISKEEIKRPDITKEMIVYWLTSFKNGDIKDVKYQQRIIDTLVNSVYVYDDDPNGKIVILFNTSSNNKKVINSSDFKSGAVPRYKSLVSVGFPKASGIFYLLCISSTYSAVIIPAGSATTAIPRNDEIIAIIRPTIVTGYISPYPTVVRDTVAQYTASK